MLILGLIFVALVIADTLITYKCIDGDKGKEVAFAKYYIDNRPLTWLVTIVMIVLQLLLSLLFMWVLLIPIAAFGYACWHNWRVLHG